MGFVALIAKLSLALVLGYSMGALAHSVDYGAISVVWFSALVAGALASCLRERIGEGHLLAANLFSIGQVTGLGVFSARWHVDHLMPHKVSSVYIASLFLGLIALAFVHTSYWVVRSVLSRGK